MNVGETWEVIDGRYTILVLGFHTEDGTEFVRCVTLVSSHPNILAGSVGLWHPRNLEDAKRLA